MIEKYRAGVINQHIDRFVAVAQGGRQRNHRVLEREISERPGDVAGAGVASNHVKFLGGRCGFGFVAPHHHEVRAELDETARSGKSDAIGGTSNDDCLASQCQLGGQTVRSLNG